MLTDSIVFTKHVCRHELYVGKLCMIRAVFIDRIVYLKSVGVKHFVHFYNVSNVN